jgi:hypothetical protein
MVVIALIRALTAGVLPLESVEEPSLAKAALPVCSATDGVCGHAG